MHRYIKIEVSCCGDCPYYDWKKHMCKKERQKKLCRKTRSMMIAHWSGKKWRK